MKPFTDGVCKEFVVVPLWSMTLTDDFKVE